MNKKIFGAGLLASMVLTSIAGIAITKAKATMTPTESYVEAKSIVASAYEVSPEDVKLYRHDMDSEIWSKIMDVNLFGDYTGVFPGYVYTAKIDDDREQILAIQLGTSKASNLSKMKLYDNPIENYIVSFPNDKLFREPFFIAQVNVSEIGIDNINSIIDGINDEIDKYNNC